MEIVKRLRHVQPRRGSRNAHANRHTETHAHTHTHTHTFCVARAPGKQSRLKKTRGIDYTRTHARTHRHTHTLTILRTRPRAHAHVHAHARTRAHAHKRTNTRIRTRKRTRARTHARKFAETRYRAALPRPANSQASPARTRGFGLQMQTRILCSLGLLSQPCLVRSIARLRRLASGCRRLVGQTCGC